MFAKHKVAKAQARRDEEWRLLALAITDPHGVISESDEVRLRAYLGEHDDANPSSPRDDLRSGQRERVTGPRVERSEQDADRRVMRSTTGPASRRLP
jgi:hypothetical protein